MWIRRAVIISLVISLLCTLTISVFSNEVIEYQNPEYQTTQEFKDLSPLAQENWFIENSISHKGFAYIVFVLTDWILFKEFLISFLMLFAMCFLSCCLMKRYGCKKDS